MNKSVSQYEFFPAWIIYFPVVVDCLVYAWKLKSLRFPVLVNPAMELSGLVDESKHEIYALLPEDSFPKTILIHPSQTLDSQITFDPAQKWIAKPDRGERGLGVKVIANKADLDLYHSQAPREYLLQKFIPGEFEVGVFFIREPDTNSIKLTPLVIKEKAAVVGNGKNTVMQLVLDAPRFRRQVKRLQETNQAIDWSFVPEDGREITLDEIRNHRRGALFRDGRYLISEDLRNAIQAIIGPIQGLNFGRIDLRTNSEQDFFRGLNLSIIEVNGVTSEPGEIYDPNISMRESWRILREHWHYVYLIAKNELQKDNRVPTWASIYALLRRARKRADFFYR